MDMEHKVIIKQSTMVKPAEKTPDRRLWLSRIDMVSRTPFSHTPSINVYRYCRPTLDDNVSFFDTKVLKESLSKALVPFYPLAGRLREGENGRFEVDCNGEGCLFIEAEAVDCSLDDLGDFKPTAELKKLVIPSWDYSKGLGSIPLFMVQITRFKCGGAILGSAGHHHLCDGWGYLMFVKYWASLARGLEPEPELEPIYDRAPHLAPRDPPQVKFHHAEFDLLPTLLSGESLNNIPVMTSLFKFTKDQVVSLKQKVASSSEVNGNVLTTYEVLAGHIWRTVCKARGLADEQEVRLSIPINLRSRLKNPPFPLGYLGNANFVVGCIAKSGEITQNPPWFASVKIHEALKRANDEEYLRSAIDYLETCPNFESLVRGAHSCRCPNMTINSWTRLTFHEADFGWGKAAFSGHGGIGYEGQSFLVANPNGDGGLSLSISLFTHHMTLFEKLLFDLFPPLSSPL